MRAALVRRATMNIAEVEVSTNCTLLTRGHRVTIRIKTGSVVDSWLDAIKQ